MIDPGFYVNIFPIRIEKEKTKVMITDRKSYPDLRPLREEIEGENKNVHVYAVEDKVYGYGKDKEWLEQRGFTEIEINLKENPKLTSRIIFEGILENAERLGFYPRFKKENGRCRLFDNNFKLTSDSNVKVFTGYDIRIIFFRSPIDEELKFGLICDVVYTLRDNNNNPLNFHQIVERYGSETLKEIRRIQKDLIPTGINTEVARQKLLEDIIPFVEKIREISLPFNDIKAFVSTSPLRIVVGE